MPIVHRLLDAFFRTLDAVDTVRDRVDRALGREPTPDPWTSEWSPEPPRAPGPAQGDLPLPEPSPAIKPKAKAPTAKAPTAKAPTGKAPAAKTSPAKAAVDDDSADAGKASKKPKAKKAGASRKGSVDRSGKDVESPRARALVDKLRESGAGVIKDDATIDGKKVLARVLWALSAARAHGAEKGLTAADASALLHLACGLEVFSTNVARACRDESSLIEESEPDGRSKRYRLTDAGAQKAASLPTRPL